MKHKVGDTVRITKRINGHPFNIGDPVEIASVNKNDYSAKNSQDIQYYFTDEECEAIEPVSNAKLIGIE